MRVTHHRTPIASGQPIAWRGRIEAFVVMLAIAAGSLALAAVPAAAGGPEAVTYPSVDCPQGQGLQACIDGLAAGSTIHIATEVVNEKIKITRSIRLFGLQDLQPKVDGIDIAGSATAVDVRLRDLRVLGGIWARLSGEPGHKVTIQHVQVSGTVPNTGTPITVQTTVPATFILERSTILQTASGRDSVAFDTNIASGSTTFRAIGNRIAQHGFNGSNGIFVRHVQAGNHRVELMNNRIWDVAACQCGLSSGIAIAADGVAHVDARIVGNTIERSAGSGIMLRNDLDPDGSFSADVFDNIIAHAQGGAIVRDSLTGATTTLRNGYNDVFRTDSKPSSPVFGPGTRFVDPRFVDRSKGDLRLKASSPLIDRGQVCTPGGIANPDAAGNHRLAGRSVDIGALEFGARKPTGIVVVGDGAPGTHLGTSGADIICGYGGRDAIDGKGGPDYLDGGPGDDILIGSGGADQMFGRSGRDLLCANDGRGTDRVDGESATDRFRADRGDRLTSVEQPGSCTGH